jgi:hypothetical protein
VDDVDPHVSRPGDADEGVEVRAVAVEVRALRVQDVREFLDVALEHAEGVRHGDHQRRDVLGHGFGERRELDVPPGAGLPGSHLENQLTQPNRHGEWMGKLTFRT